VSGAEAAVFPKGASADVALGVTSKLGSESQRDFDELEAERAVKRGGEGQRPN